MVTTFAHMGGLDEIGWILLPALAVIFFLRRAERRAREQAGEQAADVEGSGVDG